MRFYLYLTAMCGFFSLVGLLVFPRLSMAEPLMEALNQPFVDDRRKEVLLDRTSDAPTKKEDQKDQSLKVEKDAKSSSFSISWDAGLSMSMGAASLKFGGSFGTAGSPFIGSVAYAKLLKPVRGSIDWRFRLARFYSSGEYNFGWSKQSYHFEFDVGNGVFSLVDFYIKTLFPLGKEHWVSASLGRRKEALGLEALQAFPVSPFQERSVLTTLLSPGRNLGTSLSVGFFGFLIAEIGMFFEANHLGVITRAKRSLMHDGNEIQTDTRMSNTVRVFAAPIHGPDFVLHLGGAYNFRNRLIDDQGGFKFAFVPDDLFDYPSGAHLMGGDSLHTFASELLVMLGPLWFQSEFIGAAAFQRPSYSRWDLQDQEEIHESLSGNTIFLYGFYVSAGIILTPGDRRSYSLSRETMGKIKPQEIFGAFELVARWSYADLSEVERWQFYGVAHGSQIHIIDCVLNYYASSFLASSLGFELPVYIDAGDNQDIEGLQGIIFSLRTSVYF